MMKLPITARDVMSTDISTVGSMASLEEIAHILSTRRLGAVPVVDEENRVMGIVTEGDLFLKRKRVPYTSSTEPALFDEWVRPEQLPDLYRKARQLTAADVMTREVVCVDIEDTIGEVARLMVERDLKRLPVLHDAELAGMITVNNMLTLLVGRKTRA